MGIAPLFVGMFIIGFGTSAPEIVVSIFAAIQGSGGLAIGNAIGSNDTNITLVLGTTALLSPIMVQSDIYSRDWYLSARINIFYHCGKKNERELAIGNVVGSNLFNSLALIGIAEIIEPVKLEATFLFRDGLLMLVVTVDLLIFCIGVNGENKISRPEEFALVMCFIGYNLYLLLSQF